MKPASPTAPASAAEAHAGPPMAAVILDRDDTLNRDDQGHTWRVQDFAWMPGAPEALALFHARGIPCFVATNQGGIGRGHYSVEDMHAFNAHLRREAIKADGLITDVAFCPHHPEARVERLRRSCDHRKPGPGMLLWLARKWNLDLGASVMIGDKLRDMQAAEAAGCTGYRFDGGDLHALAQRVLAEAFQEKRDPPG